MLGDVAYDDFPLGRDFFCFSTLEEGSRPIIFHAGDVSAPDCCARNCEDCMASA